MKGGAARDDTMTNGLFLGLFAQTLFSGIKKLPRICSRKRNNSERPVLFPDI